MNKLITLIMIVLLVAVTAGIALAGAETNRFSGGSYDGYRLAVITNTTIKDGVPAGMMMIIR